MNFEITFTTFQTLSGSNLNVTALLTDGSLESEAIKHTVADLTSVPMDHIAIIGVVNIGERRRLSDLRIEYEITTTTQDMGSSDAQEAFQSITSSLVDHTAAIEGGGVTLFESQLRIYSIQIAQEMGMNVTAAAQVFSDVTSAESEVATTFSQVVLRTAFPSSTPTSQPTCGLGAYDAGNGSGCGDCPPGTFRSLIEVHGDKGCDACGMDEYSATYGNAACEKCNAPASTIGTGSTSCDAFSLRGSIVTSVVVFVVIILIFGYAIYMAGADKVAFAVLSFLPAMDFISDVVYVTQVRFYQEYVFYIAILCLFLSGGAFMWELYTQRAKPQFWIDFPGHYLCKRVLWLWRDKFSPVVDGKTFDFDQHENLLKLVGFCILWVLLIVAQVAWVALYIVWCALHCIIWGPLLVMGMLLFQLKGMCVKQIYIGWVELWAGKEKCDVIKEKLRKSNYEQFPVDAGMMNESIMSEFILESIPQLILQGLNNSATGQWRSTVTLFSFVFSLTVIGNSFYRFGYLRFVKKMSIKAVPYTIILPYYDNDGKWYKTFSLKRPDDESLEVLQFSIVNTKEAKKRVCKAWVEILSYMLRRAEAGDFDATKEYADIIITYSICSPLTLASKPEAIKELHGANTDALNRNLTFLAKSISESDGLEILTMLVNTKVPKKEDEETGFFNFDISTW